jgi:hypothetical protein
MEICTRAPTSIIYRPQSQPWLLSSSLRPAYLAILRSPALSASVSQGYVSLTKDILCQPCTDLSRMTRSGLCVCAMIEFAVLRLSRADFRQPAMCVKTESCLQVIIPWSIVCLQWTRTWKSVVKCNVHAAMLLSPPLACEYCEDLLKLSWGKILKPWNNIYPSIMKVFTKFQINPSTNSWENYIKSDTGTNRQTDRQTDRQTNQRTKSHIEVLARNTEIWKPLDNFLINLMFHHRNLNSSWDAPSPPIIMSGTFCVTLYGRRPAAHRAFG